LVCFTADHNALPIPHRYSSVFCRKESFAHRNAVSGHFTTKAPAQCGIALRLVENVLRAALQPVDLLRASAERSGCNGPTQLEG